MSEPQNSRATCSPKSAWNKGKLVGAKPPLQPKHVWAIRTRLQFDGRLRDLALFNLAVDSKLRACDLVRLRIEDVAPHGYAVQRASVQQRKTGRPVRFEITEQSREAVDTYLAAACSRVEPWLFPGRRGRPLTTRQYARLLDHWLFGIGLEPALFGTHSLRRTKATLIYRRTGNLRAVQLLLGHSKIESTVRYLGVEVDDAVVIRHPDTGAPRDYASFSGVPVINGGDGIGPGAEHPTQALIDLLTIRQTQGRLDRLAVIMTGELHSRAARSLMYALRALKNRSFFSSTRTESHSGRMSVCGSAKEDCVSSASNG